MSLDLKVSALTASLRSEFWKAWDSVAKPAPWNDVTSILPSTTKIENFIIQSPVPQFQLWRNQRNFAQTDSQVFAIRNETWHDDLMATLEDVEDEQTDFLMMQPKILAEKGKIFPGRMVYKLLGQACGSPIALASGQVGNFNGFDNLLFFSNRSSATPNAFGIGNNVITYTASAGDGKTYNLVALMYDYMLKPLGWLNRSGPDFRTNSGDNNSHESRVVKWWCDLRGAPFFTYWYNAVQVQIINTPNVAEMHAIFAAVIAAFRTFQFPKTISTEDGEYVHEQTIFDSNNLYYVGSSYLSEQLDQALSESWIPQSIGTNTVATTNRWKGKAKWTVTRFLDNF